MTDGIWYLDSSALVKLAVLEPESDALASALMMAPRAATSALARVEVLRRVRPHGEGAVQEALSFLNTLQLVPLNDPILESAGELLPVELRTLDAIHIASALALGDALEVLVTYDRRMAEAAEAIGIRVAAPA